MNFVPVAVGIVGLGEGVRLGVGVDVGDGVAEGQSGGNGLHSGLPRHFWKSASSRHKRYAVAVGEGVSVEDGVKMDKASRVSVAVGRLSRSPLGGSHGPAGHWARAVISVEPPNSRPMSTPKAAIARILLVRTVYSIR